jgi:hypothetical protein
VANQFSEKSYFPKNNSQAELFPERKLNWSTWHIVPNKVSGLLLKIIASLLFLSFVERKAIDWLSTSTNLQLPFHYFDFNGEGNFPSLYSALALGLCSLLLALIFQIKKSIQSREKFAPKDRDRKYWMALSYIFLYLALDEFCSIHELLVKIIASAVTSKSLLPFTGSIVGSIVVIVFLISFRKLIVNLPPKIRTLFFIAGGLYLLGVSEIKIISTIKELLEMLGVVVFIHGLLIYIKSYLVELNGSFFFEKPIK